MSPRAWPWLLVALAALAAWALLRLPAPAPAASSAGMSTATKAKAKTTTRATATRRPGKPRVSRAAFVAQVKAVAARVASGEERVYTREEMLREMDL